MSGLVGATVVALLASLLVAVPAQAAPSPGSGPASAAPDKSVPVSKVPVKTPAKADSAAAVLHGMPQASWPAAGTASVDPASAGAQPGGLPVRVFGGAASDVAARTRGEANAAALQGAVPVRVAVSDQSAAGVAGVRGVLLSVARADARAGRAEVGLSVSYAKFASAYGADYGYRLQLMSMPACAVNTPELVECQKQTPVASTNDPVTQTVTAEQVSLNGSTASVMALASSPAGTSSAADWTATDLSSAYSWTSGTSGGDFSLAYPIKVPAGLGGPQPAVSLGYSSGSVDAKTASKSGQSSVVGEGWDLSVGGYLERSFRSCADDGSTGQDLCWVNAGAVTMMLNGRSTKLVSDANGWHAVGDEKLRIESINETNAALANGARGGEYWKVTTQDGTQYYFGRHKRYAGDTATTNSVLTEPVIHNNVGEPCHAAPGWCQEAYRWNLDYVVDPRGNTMTLFYNKFQGKTGFNGTSVLLYDLSATLDRIEYGTRQGTEAAAAAPMRVTFGYAERCWTSCTWPTSGYADTPGDLFCATTATTCANVKSPMHFTRYRLSTVTTQVYASAYRNVDKWDLDQTFLTSGDYITPAGDDTAPNLWLNGLTHTGYAADGITTQAEPQTTFGGERKANRTDWSDALGMAPFMHWRIKYVYNGVGGQTTVNYADTDCVNQAPKVNSDSNPFRCFPQFYKGPASESAFGYFNKYVVSSVVETDLTGGSPAETTSYAYSTEGSLDAALWGHDDVDLANVTYTSWADWRGYPTVTTTHGTVAGQQTVSKTTYHRGLLGDAKKNGTDTAVLFDQRQSFTLEPLQPASAIPVAIAGGLNANRLCLDIVNYGTGNGAGIQSYTCTGDWNQVWQRLTDGSNAIKNPQSGKCLDVYGGGTANGTSVQLYTCTNVPAQQWLRQPDGSLKNVGSGRCLDINNYSTLPIGPVEIYDCHGYSNQQWMPTNAGALQNVQGNRCLDATGGGTANGTTIQNYGCAWNDNQGNQVWQLETDGTVRNPSSGRCLTVNASGTANGTGTYLWDCTAAPKQIWQAQTDGSLKNPSTNRCLDSGGSSAPNGAVVIWDCNGNLSQQWVGRTPDKAALNGMARTSFTVDNGTVTGYTVHTYTTTQTASRQAYATSGASVRSFLTRENQTKIGNRISATGSWRWAQTDTTYDTYGLVTSTRNVGDVAGATDDRCTQTSYAQDTTAWLINYVAQTTVTDCTTSPAPANYLGGDQLLYDNTTSVGAAPTKGLPTKALSLSSFSGSTAVWAVVSETGYDLYGRTTSAKDALGNLTTTNYTQSYGAVVGTTVTNALNHKVTNSIDPGHGSVLTSTDQNDKVTTLQYDPLGRRTGVYLPRPSTGMVASYAVTSASQSFVDIPDGTLISLTGDEAHTQVTFPFTFSFYGQSYSTAWLSANGFLSFTDHATDPTPAALPSTTAPNAGVYPFWDDLVLDATSKVYAKTTGTAPNRQFTIEYSQALLAGRTKRVTFSMTFAETSNTITFNYAGLDSATPDTRGAAAVVGIEDGQGVRATLYSSKQAVLGNDKAVLFAPAKVPGTALPDVAYVYTTSTGSVNVTETKMLTANNTQMSAFALFDGRMRLRQEQEFAPQGTGGRIISDTTYDARGLVSQETTFWNSASPSSTLAGFTNAAVDSQQRYSYDTLERSTQTALYSQDVLKSHNDTSYDGDRETTVPAGGGATVTITDAMGRTSARLDYPTAIVGGTPETTTYLYDRADNLTKITDPAGSITSYAYNLLGQRISTTDPDGGTTTNQYNANGMVTSSTDSRGKTLSMQYDALGRLTDRWDGPATTGTRLATYAYDTLAKGKPTSTTRWANGNPYVIATTGYTDDYQPTGHTITIPTAEGQLAGTYQSANTYDLAGRIATETFPAGGGLAAETVTSGYDTTARPTTLTGNTTYIASTGYTSFGKTQNRVYGSPGAAQLTRTYGWDAATGRLASISATLPNAAQPTNPIVLQNDTYGYTPTGDITQIKDGTDNQSRCFRTDGQDRLTEAWTALDACVANPAAGTIAASGKAPFWDIWTFDAAGRRVADSHRTSATAVTNRTFTYPAIGAAHMHGMQSVQYTGAVTRTDTMHYDNSGNTTDRTINGVLSNFTYDAEGRIGSAVVHAGSGDQTTTYVYDAGGGQLLRRDPSGTTLYALGEDFRRVGATVAATRRYQHNGATVAVRTGTALSWIAADHQRSASIAVDATSAAVQKHLYTPYGADRSTTGTWPTDRGFLDKQTNPSTGLIEIGRRQYDPELGVFMSEDPLIVPSDPTTFNPYAYSAHNPVTNSDPSGLMKGNIPGHDAAVAMRMQALKAEFPDAHVAGDIGNSYLGADIVCWDCKDGEVWVWEVKPEGTSPGEIENSLWEDLRDTKLDPRTGGKTVLRGPMFGGPEINRESVQSGFAMSITDLWVTVRDTNRRGVQLYTSGGFPGVPGRSRDEFEDEGDRRGRQVTNINNHSEHGTYSRQYRKPGMPAPSWVKPKPTPATVSAGSRRLFSDAKDLNTHRPSPSCAACGGGQQNRWTPSRTGLLIIGTIMAGTILAPFIVAGFGSWVARGAFS